LIKIKTRRKIKSGIFASITKLGHCIVEITTHGHTPQKSPKTKIEWKKNPQQAKPNGVDCSKHPTNQSDIQARAKKIDKRKGFHLTLLCYWPTASSTGFFLFPSASLSWVRGKAKAPP
jgi:hypothetical protein